MKLGKVIETVNRIKGQQYDTEIMTSWINEIEGQAIDETVNRAEGFSVEFKPFDYKNDMDAVLVIPDRFEDVYLNYIYAKIDFNNQDTERYNNDVAMFNAAYEAYSAWFRRTNMPKQRNSFRGV